MRLQTEIPKSDQDKYWLSYMNAAGRPVDIRKIKQHWYVNVPAINNAVGMRIPDSEAEEYLRTVRATRVERMPFT